RDALLPIRWRIVSIRWLVWRRLIYQMKEEESNHEKVVVRNRDTDQCACFFADGGGAGACGGEGAIWGRAGAESAEAWLAGGGAGGGWRGPGGIQHPDGGESDLCEGGRCVG